MSQNRIKALIPHREPMLLIDEVLELNGQGSSSLIRISEASSFYIKGKGVPSWIGVEYMGQTAAMIAGYQLEQGQVEPHVGLLLGTRKYNSTCAWFIPGSILHVSCQELAVVGQGLATFHCEIKMREQVLASAKLSVFRKPIETNTNV
jgi:predicted hotdog family 3-hydroxylacyl-ACP dehydratase